MPACPPRFVRLRPSHSALLPHHVKLSKRSYSDDPIHWVGQFHVIPVTDDVFFSLQLKRLNNAHPHIVHTYGVLRGVSGSAYIMQERAVCDLHDAAGACAGRVMGEGEHVKEWMLQVAHGTCAVCPAASVRLE